MADNKACLENEKKTLTQILEEDFFFSQRVTRDQSRKYGIKGLKYNR